MNDPIAPMVETFEGWPETQQEAIDAGVVTAWRTDKLRQMSYTQFLLLVREGHVESVRFTGNMKNVDVTTKASAPLGRRTERVGLIYDPHLYDYLCSHGVTVLTPTPDKLVGVQMGIVRAFAPFVFALFIIKASFSLGRKRQPDRLFGGARMQQINSNDIPITFNDIAGIDEVKAEIMEIVTFLREQERFLKLGARSPAGVLLVGPPGTGKTLLAKAIAGEAGVPFFSSSGTDFTEMYVGVGASRVRDMFERARKNAPCILFIDEFDGIGQARSSTDAGNDESVHTINQLLTELDGFDDNTGVVVLAATNRPGSLDEALTRPGRFDRVISLPLPNLDGRVGILQVHARDKRVDPAVNFRRIARATAGFTGAELMNLMNTAAIEAVRQKRDIVLEDDVFQALEKIHNEKYGGGVGDAQFEDGKVTPLIRRTIAVYMAARALMGCITPEYDELQKVVVTPQGMPTGYTYFIPQDAHLESRITTRSFVEAHLVVALAGRVAEQAVMGAANMTTAGANDLRSANALAREMIFRCGWSKRLGPINITDESIDYLAASTTRKMANMSPAMASAALTEIEAILAAAEAKAFFGLVANWEVLQALVDRIMEKDNHVLNRTEVQQLLKKHGAVSFADCFIEGFAFKADRTLSWPTHYDYMVKDAAHTAAGRPSAVPIVTQAMHALAPDVHPLNPYQPSGPYDQMSQRMLAGDEFYFKPEVWSHMEKGNGAGRNGTAEVAAEGASSASR